MPAAAAAPFAEAALAESFAAAAPEMFMATESFIPAAGALGELAPMAGMGELAGGLGAGLFGEFGGSLAGQALGGAYPSLAEAATQGTILGGGGAGTAGINEAMIAQQQANAAAAANSGAPLSDLVSNQTSGQGLGNVTPTHVASTPSAAAPAQVERFVPRSAPQPTLYGSSTQGIDTYLGGPVPKYFEDAVSAAPANAPAGIDTATHPLGSSAERQALFGNTEGAYGLQGYDNRFMPLEQPSGLQAGFQKALDFAKENPLSAVSLGYSAMKLLGSNQNTPQKEEYNGILTKYKMSPDFKGRFARPEDYQYTPKVYTNAAEGGIMQAYAGGGPVEVMSNANAVGANTGYPMADVNKGAYATPYQQPISRNVVSGASDTGVNPMTGEMSFARGGKTTDELAMDYYERMTRKPEAPSDKSDVGIYYDLDPDTRYLDPLTAAQIRMAKVNKRANMQLPGMKRPTPMGQINLAPPGMKAQDSGPVTEAAGGGIMSLGGYAAGGNPRLLKGPGDGMSDNIPATIAGKQPARLADGEFVVPADVVSHLGNGSTDAGAKKLHQMMTNVRKARTGNPKQGKQINPNKYMPK